MSGNDPRGAEHYRNLFEGSQASLSDMAARQAQALARVGRLRSAIVAVLRKNFMELSAQAEANLGGRLSEIDDEILLAYLDAFTAAASRGDQRATIQALKEAVMTLGIPLRGDEPLVWVEQIHQHRQANPRSAETPGRHAPEETATVPHDGGDARRPALIPASPAERPLPVDDYWKWDDAPALADLFGDIGEEPAPSTTEIVGEPRRWGNELGEVSGEDERWSPSPIVPGRTPVTGPGPAPAVALEPEETIPVRPTAPAPDTGETTTTDETTPSPSGRPRKAAAKRQPRRRATAPGEDTATGDPDATGTAIENPTTSDPTTSDPAASGSETRVENATDQAPATEPDTGMGDGLGDLFDEPSAPVIDEWETAAPLEATTTRPTGNTPTAPSPSLVDGPMRPELFAPTSSGRRRRGTRTRATAPVENLTLPEASPALELNDGMRRALLAAAAIPRPVFTRDLIGVAGSLAMVDAWEAECRADISNSPVRFVAPKSRHRLRGHLVAVEPETVRPTDWWYQAVQRYRAGRLYELGVLLHRVGDEVVSFTLEEQLAVFHLNTPRGLVGMIVILDPRPAGAATSSELAAHVERLLAERLTMIVALTASAEPGSLEGLVSHIEDLARERGWQPTSPVIAARSWEYADDRGTSAVMVLGQG